MGTRIDKDTSIYSVGKIEKWMERMERMERLERLVTTEENRIE